jgi:hypothetical protein
MVTDAPEGEIGVAATEGVFTIAKAAGAIAKGDLLYYNSTNKNLTTTAAGNKFAGIAYSAALNADIAVEIYITGASNDAMAAVVAPLGNTADFTAVEAVFANLAAARTAVNTLATESEARIAAAEAKIDAVLTALKNANLMASA